MLLVTRVVFCWFDIVGFDLWFIGFWDCGFVCCGFDLSCVLWLRTVWGLGCCVLRCTICLLIVLGGFRLLLVFVDLDLISCSWVCWLIWLWVYVCCCWWDVVDIGSGFVLYLELFVWVWICVLRLNLSVALRCFDWFVICGWLLLTVLLFVRAFDF